MTHIAGDRVNGPMLVAPTVTALRILVSRPGTKEFSPRARIMS